MALSSFVLIAAFAAGAVVFRAGALFARCAFGRAGFGVFGSLVLRRAFVAAAVGRVFDLTVRDFAAVVLRAVVVVFARADEVFGLAFDAPAAVLRGFFRAVVFFAAADVFLVDAAVVLAAGEAGFFEVVFVPADGFLERAEAPFDFAADAARADGVFTFGFAVLTVAFEVVFGFPSVPDLADFAELVLAEDGLRVVLFRVSLSSSFFLGPVILALAADAEAVFLTA